MSGIDVNDVVASVLNEYGAVCAELERTRGYLRDRVRDNAGLERKLSDANAKMRSMKTGLDVMSDYSERLETILINDHQYDKKTLSDIFDKSRRVYEEDGE